MNWKYAKALNSVDLINDFEKLVGYKFPKEFRDLVFQFNGGRPERKRFDTNVSIGRELKSFLSFNTGDRETVWKIKDWNKDELSNKYLAFAIDNFGNLICFDKNNNNVVLLNHEDLSVEHIANTFSEFIETLYK